MTGWILAGSCLLIGFALEAYAYRGAPRLSDLRKQIRELERNEP